MVGEVSREAWHWRARRSLGAWLRARGVPALCGVDTRALTVRLRAGVTLARIVIGTPPFGPLPPLADPNLRNLVAEVSIKVRFIFGYERGIRIYFESGKKSLRRRRHARPNRDSARIVMATQLFIVNSL